MNFNEETPVVGLKPIPVKAFIIVDKSNVAVCFGNNADDFKTVAFENDYTAYEFIKRNNLDNIRNSHGSFTKLKVKEITRKEMLEIKVVLVGDYKD
jgi:hypothetical protein